MNIIQDKSNEELLMLYKHALVNRYMQLRNIQGFYHPVYEHNNINMNHTIFAKRMLYKTHEMTILKEIWNRYTDGTFYEQAWWQSKKILFTRISFYKEDSLPFNKLQSKENKMLNSTKIETIIYNNNVYTFFNSGLKRKVYLSSDKSHVIKVPKNNLGVEENVRESMLFLKDKLGIYAKCELLIETNSWLKMEFIQEKCFTKNDDLPSWVNTIPNAQVGYNKEGRLLAFDYGSDI